LETGLFGTLGDERVQIIDASDLARLNAYFDLAVDCEKKGKALWPQDFVESLQKLSRRD
jgi:hypothetical protein